MPNGSQMGRNLPLIDFQQYRQDNDWLTSVVEVFD